jgi:hypothetical protein
MSSHNRIRQLFWLTGNDEYWVLHSFECPNWIYVVVKTENGEAIYRHNSQKAKNQLSGNMVAGLYYFQNCGDGIISAKSC